MDEESKQVNGDGLSTKCRCGRVYTHCLACGQRKPYVKKKRSAELSFELAKRVWVYSCTNCPVETHSGMECQAPSVETGIGYKGVPFQKTEKQQELPPWGNSLPGSIERGRLLSEWVVEMQAKKTWGPIKVYVEAQKAGWQLEAFPEIDEEIKQACMDLGLWPVEVSMRGDAVVNTTEKPPDIQGSIQDPMSLDEIIKHMQKEQT